MACAASPLVYRARQFPIFFGLIDQQQVVREWKWTGVRWRFVHLDCHLVFFKSVCRKWSFLAFFRCWIKKFRFRPISIKFEQNTHFQKIFKKWPFLQFYSINFKKCILFYKFIICSSFWRCSWLNLAVMIFFRKWQPCCAWRTTAIFGSSLRAGSVSQKQTFFRTLSYVSFLQLQFKISAIQYYFKVTLFTEISPSS